MNGVEFEVEVTSVKQAQEQLAAIRDAFGEETFIKFALVAGDKSRVLKTLDESIKKTAEEIAAKLRRKD